MTRVGQCGNSTRNRTLYTIFPVFSLQLPVYRELFLSLWRCHEQDQEGMDEVRRSLESRVLFRRDTFGSLVSQKEIYYSHFNWGTALRTQDFAPESAPRQFSDASKKSHYTLVVFGFDLGALTELPDFFIPWSLSHEMYQVPFSFIRIYHDLGDLRSQ